MTKERENGDLRVRSEGNSIDTMVEVWTESGWTRINGLTSIEWSIHTGSIAEMKITALWPELDVFASKETVILGQYKKHNES